MLKKRPRRCLQRRAAEGAEIEDRNFPRRALRLCGASNVLFPHPARLGVVIAICIYCLAQSRDEWVQFRGDSQLTGVSAAVLPKTLKVLWTYEAGDSVESSAAIAGGSVFVGSQGGYLIALDLQKGGLKWKYPTKEGIGESSPAVANGIVYVGDLGGILHAVDAGSGKMLWTFKTASEIKSSPVLVDDKLLIGSYDGNLYCLAARTGKLVWKFQTDNYVHSTPSVAGGLTYIAGCDEVFRGIRISDGQQAFEIPAAGYIAASPALAGDHAYFGTFSNEVLGVDLRARKILWHYEHPERHFPFYSSAAVWGDRVVLGGRDKYVHCINAKTGKAIWTFLTKARVDSSPAIAGDRVYIGSGDGRFYVLDLAKGAKIWEFNAGGPISVSPAVAAGHIVIGTQDGRIYCFG